MGWAKLDRDGSGQWRSLSSFTVLFLFFQVDLDAKYSFDLP